jgi:hypothetical protein
VQHIPPPDVVIPIVLLIAAVGVYLWRRWSRTSALLGTIAATVPPMAYFLAPSPVYHLTLISCLILWIAYGLWRSRASRLN